MNIQEAVKNALEGNMMIYRESAKGECADIYAVIKPTNTYDTCLLLVKTSEGDKKSCRSWNPTADDLIADDWQVSEYKAEVLMIEKLDKTIEKLCDCIQSEADCPDGKETEISIMASALAHLVNARTNAHIIEESGNENYICSSSGKERTAL